MLTVLNKISFAHKLLDATSWKAHLQADGVTVARKPQWRRDAYAGAKIGAQSTFPVRFLLGKGPADYMELMRSRRSLDAGLVNYVSSVFGKSVGLAGGSIGSILGGLIGCVTLSPASACCYGYDRGKQGALVLVGVPGQVLAAAAGVVSLLVLGIACGAGAMLGILFGAMRGEWPQRERSMEVSVLCDEELVNVILRDRDLTKEQQKKELLEATKNLRALHSEVNSLDAASAKFNGCSPRPHYDRARDAITEALLLLFEAP